LTIVNLVPVEGINSTLASHGAGSLAPYRAAIDVRPEPRAERRISA
jgi:hypothetical protein